MKKTSVYLSDEDRARLARLAEREGKSQAFVLREALAMYDASRPDRDFELFGNFTLREGVPPPPDSDDPQDFQDWVDQALMEGFGDDGALDPQPLGSE
jgi:hypothetical protein